MMAVMMPFSGETPDAMPKRDRQRQGHDADDDAGHEVGGEFLPGVVLQGCEKCGSEFDHLRIFILRLILRLKNGGAKVVKMREDKTNGFVFIPHVFCSLRK